MKDETVVRSLPVFQILFLGGVECWCVACCVTSQRVTSGKNK